MDFPQEIWKYIFSYFHSLFKKPEHFNVIDYIINYKPQIGWQRVRNLHDNFYLYLLFNTMINDRRKKLTFPFKCRPLISFKRFIDINSPMINGDFKKIRKYYIKQ